MNAIQAVVFDLYGTLLDVNSVVQACEDLFPGHGQALSAQWRQKQLEYSWQRSLMSDFADFDQVTADALRFSCARLGLPLDASSQSALCAGYLRLRPFPEVAAALAQLQARGLPLAVLSNGTRPSIDAAVRNAGLEPSFAHLISVDEVGIFKPHPSVYALAEQHLGLRRTDMLFVSSNAWDASGAAHFGFRTVWVNRGGLPFDQLGQQPAHTVRGLDGVAPLLGPRTP